MDESESDHERKRIDQKAIVCSGIDGANQPESPTSRQHCRLLGLFVGFLSLAVALALTVAFQELVWVFHFYGRLVF